MKTIQNKIRGKASPLFTFSIIRIQKFANKNVRIDYKVKGRTESKYEEGKKQNEHLFRESKDDVVVLRTHVNAGYQKIKRSMAEDGDQNVRQMIFVN